MQERRRARRTVPRLEPLDDRCLLSGYTSAQITSAYALNTITFPSSNGSTIKGDGLGQTIALIDEYHDPHIRSDLETFDRTSGLPHAALTVVNQAGDRTDHGWALEESMDVEYAHAIAPGARILVVEAAPSRNPTKELQNQLNAVNAARHVKGVVAIAMSWGYQEISNEASYDQDFTTPAGHQGITFIASSGDLGYAEYPAASPKVLSVGGTSLELTSSGSYQSEAAWFLSGGGYSVYEPEPGYQTSVQSTGQRAVPDVAFDAASSTGVAVYDTSPHSHKGSWQVIAGTSLGAPAWAGIIAIVDQGRALAGKGSLDGPSQTLPALYALPSSDFHSVDPSSRVGGLSSWLDYLFGSGSEGDTANIATGLGSPNGRSLIPDLVASPTTSPTTNGGGPSARGGAPTSAIQPIQPTGGGWEHHPHIRHGHTTSRTKAHPGLPRATDPVGESPSGRQADIR
jgi:hypothetical protein